MPATGRASPLQRISLLQFPADDIDSVADEAYDICRVDFDIAAIDHHVDGVLERFPDVICFVDVRFTELGCSAKDWLIEVLEEFCKERVRRDADADFWALDVKFASDVRVGGQNECVRAGHALLDDVEREIAHAGVARGESDVGDNERHEEFFHGLFEGVELVNRFGGFGITADGVTGFCGVEDETVVFEDLGGLLYDACLRVFWMYFESHNILCLYIFAF